MFVPVNNKHKTLHFLVFVIFNVKTKSQPGALLRIQHTDCPKQCPVLDTVQCRLLQLQYSALAMYNSNGRTSALT